VRELGELSASLAARVRPEFDATSEELVAAAAMCHTVRGLFRFLDLPYDGFAHARMVRRLREEGVDTSHFLGQRANTGRKFPGRAKPLAEILVVGGSYSTHTLRRRLIEEGVLEPECSCCRLRTWNERPIPLELDHINGDRSDNRLENLRLLCPNCHAQTDTYRGRNIGRSTVGAGSLPTVAGVAFEGRARLAAVLGRAG
jgi:hypothetical protein